MKMLIVMSCIFVFLLQQQVTCWQNPPDAQLERMLKKLVAQRTVQDDCDSALEQLFADFVEVEDVDQQSADKERLLKTCVDAGGPTQAIDALSKCMDEEEDTLPETRLVARLLDLLLRDQTARSGEVNVQDECNEAVPKILVAFTGSVSDVHHDAWMSVCVDLGGIHAAIQTMTKCVEERLAAAAVRDACESTLNQLFAGFIQAEDDAQQSADKEKALETCVDAGGPSQALDMLSKCMDEEEETLTSTRLAARLMALFRGQTREVNVQDECNEAVPTILVAFTGSTDDAHHDVWMSVCVDLGGVHGTLEAMSKCVKGHVAGQQE